MALTVEQLLGGASGTQDIELPAAQLPAGVADVGNQVTIRPLTVRDVQRIAHASRQDAELSASLIIQLGLVDPALSLDQVVQLPAGLARILVDRINLLSGISLPRDDLAEMVQAPLARACFVLAREFGWTPEEVSGMTIGQILLYLEMAQEGQAT